MDNGEFLEKDVVWSKVAQMIDEGDVSPRGGMQGLFG